MKVLVDSTVWIDFLRGRATSQTARLEQCLHSRDDLCCCGFVLAEVLQGVRTESEYVATKRQFETLVYLEADRSTFELGATIYRELRRKGVSIRNSIDCLIAAVVIQHGVHLLENDRDYRFIDQHYPLDRL
ncbi:MAG: PIN domain-containing protein [Undibacterium sp.]|nr:PIN domain-containing protein [Opitutaceae bacterium]